MPPLVQDVFFRLGHVIGCFRVSRLKLRYWSWPLAGQAMRGAGAHQTLGLISPFYHAAFSAPDLANRLPLLFVDLLTLPRVRRGVRSGCCRRRILEVHVYCHDGPKPARHHVCECDGHQHARFLGRDPPKPFILGSSLPARVRHDGYGRREGRDRHCRNRRDPWHGLQLACAVSLGCGFF